MSVSAHGTGSSEQGLPLFIAEGGKALGCYGYDRKRGWRCLAKLYKSTCLCVCICVSLYVCLSVCMSTQASGCVRLKCVGVRAFFLIATKEEKSMQKRRKEKVHFPTSMNSE